MHRIPDTDTKRTTAAGAFLLAILPWDQGEGKTVAA
jgi:hypothetical protein